MKVFLLFGLLLSTPLLGQAADTAYTALRVFGKRDGQEVLNHVIELRGRNGAPQPDVWKIIVDDPRARGGIRELEIQRGKIVGERTPTSRNAGSPMNFNQLNLDSEGAFTIANQEAQKINVPFDHVDYVLHSGSGGGAPVWDLELSDTRGGRLGTITIAADSGTILRKQLDRPRGNGQDDRAYLDDRQNPPPPNSRNYDGAYDNGEDSQYSRPGEHFKSVPDFFHRLGQRFQKRGHQLENFFTGKGFHGPNDPDNR